MIEREPSDDGDALVQPGLNLFVRNGPTWQRSLEARLLEELDVPGVGPCIAFAKDAQYQVRPAEEMKARLITETILMSAIKTWARNLGFGSFDKFELRTNADRQPRVGTFQWDMAAPSYIGGLATWAPGTTPKPGFVVFDVLLGRDISDRRPLGHFH